MYILPVPYLVYRLREYIFLIKSVAFRLQYGYYIHISVSLCAHFTVCLVSLGNIKYGKYGKYT